MPINIDRVEYDNLTQAERDALVSPPKGTVIYNLTSGQLEVNDGTGGSPSWTAASVGNLTKADVGLGNVDNTSDADKPVSTAQQTALDDKISNTEKGAANGVATLDAGGKVPASQIPLEFMEYKGNWDASTNTPTLADSDTGVLGNAYTVNVAGTVDFGAGPITFAVGDWVINDGSVWDKVINSSAVSSVNGFTGVVTLKSDDISDTGELNKFVTSGDITNLSNLSGTNTGDNIQATETVLGIAELATQTEQNTGTDDLKIVTPLKLKNWTQDRIKFNTALTKPSYQAGLMFYDKDEYCMVAYNDEADVTQQIGREFYRRVRNETGSTILNGKVVYQSGAETGGEGRALIGLAKADSAATENVIGVATHDIENNSYGYVTILGDVNNVDTSLFSAGSVLYLSPTVAGTLTATKPDADQFVVEVATAEIINATTGRLNVNITNFGRLTDFSVIQRSAWESGLDVTENSPIDGTVDYTSGSYFHLGVQYNITAGNYDLSALYLASLADGEKVYVAIHVDETGVIESTLGTKVTSSSSVQFAPIPAGDVCIAQVLIHRSSGTLQPIQNKVIIDCRNAADPNSVDEFVKISFEDTTRKYLQDAITAGAGITINKLNAGANEQLEIVASSSSTNYQTVTFGAHNAPDISTASSVYDTKRYFDYQGSTAQGSISKITAATRVNSGTGGKIRIYDVTNSLVIAEKTNISNTGYSVIDLGTITNIPTGAAVFRIDLAGDGANACHLGSITFKF